jgi:hypothetical protein
MASYTWEPQDLRVEGANIPLLVAVTNAAEAALNATGQPIPQPVSVEAQIDTGASSSVIQLGKLAPLGLNPVGQTFINTPSSQNLPCLQYAVRLLFPQHAGFVELATVTEAPLQGQNIQFLIGRDVLHFGLLIYNGTHGSFTLAF